ncbi:MAG: hypothetical protein B7X48_08190 [Acidiphilium sp. 34-60-192]|nr:MAG: hypothetical protein B7X48_08190 [Acidiphilium sp. 34-60-192]
MSPFSMDAYGFTLVLARVSAAVMLMPGFGEAPIPPMVRVGLSLALCAVLWPMVASTLPPPSTNEIATAFLIAKESLIGGAIGWIARTLVLALQSAPSRRCWRTASTLPFPRWSSAVRCLCCRCAPWFTPIPPSHQDYLHKSSTAGCTSPQVQPCTSLSPACDRVSPWLSALPPRS